MDKQDLKTEELKLEGFHCADCAVTIEQTVAKLNGVEEVKASFTSGKVKVSYLPGEVNHADLVRSVEKIGYRVTREAHKNIEGNALWKDREAWFTALSGLFLAVGLALRVLGQDAVVLEVAGRGFSPSAFVLLAATVFGAYFFSREGWAAVRAFRVNMDFLMTLAIAGALIIAEYIEAASLAFLFSLAELLESYAVERSRNSLRELMQLTPDVARVRREGKEVSVPAKEVAIGDVVLVRPGEKIAVDGEVLKGTSSVDQSPITGESVPVSKQTGDAVFAGSINVEGYLEVRTTRRSDHTMLARIIHLIEDAESQKAPSERFVDRFARFYTPSIVALAVLVATVPPLLLGGAFHLWFVKALTLLVIACPCALVISTPVSVISALTSASRNGVLIKGGVYLEEMGSVKAIAFDKTGTLTKGELVVTDVIALNGDSDAEIGRLAASLEQRSSHPIAKAIVAHADGMSLHEVGGFESIPGKGVWGEMGDKRFYLGRPELFRDFSVEIPTQKLHLLQKAGKTTMLLGTPTEVLGIIAVRDEIREEAAEMVRRLKSDGKEVVMITGDNEETARAIAAQLGIDHYHAALLPEEKVEEIKRLQAKYGKVAMVGDGINDAPALAVASVGIAMGVAGSDSALETADVALMSDQLSRVPYLVELSQKAKTVIKENILASIVVKFSLALGVFPGLVTLVVAVLVGDMGASLGVTSNAMRLARFAPED